MSPTLITVGGFLGAGKTTLIVAASRLLLQIGKKVAVILNDQGNNLVDTAHGLQEGLLASEIAGGCFCCRFSELLTVVNQMRVLNPDVIFLEPVGSCTDLAATVLRPLLEEGAERFVIAPMTVLVDPERSAQAIDSSMRFLMAKQIAEADLVVFSKSDLHRSVPPVPGTMVRSLSARSGTGVQTWLDEVLSGTLSVAVKDLAIDYAEYAQAEAALGWLNWTGRVQLRSPLSPAELIGPWVDRLQTRLREREIPLAHLKVLDQTGGAWLKVAATSNEIEPTADGDVTASPHSFHSLRINMRAVADPAILGAIFQEELAQMPGKKVTNAFQCFSPGAPVPERRVSAVRAAAS